MVMMKMTSAEKKMMGMLAKRRRQSKPIIRLIEVGHVCHRDKIYDLHLPIRIGNKWEPSNPVSAFFRAKLGKILKIRKNTQKANFL